MATHKAFTNTTMLPLPKPTEVFEDNVNDSITVWEQRIQDPKIGHDETDTELKELSPGKPLEWTLNTTLLLQLIVSFLQEAKEH